MQLALIFSNIFNQLFSDSNTNCLNELFMKIKLSLNLNEKTV